MKLIECWASTAAAELQKNKPEILVSFISNSDITEFVALCQVDKARGNEPVIAGYAQFPQRENSKEKPATNLPIIDTLFMSD